jgi:hypothetical protein
MQPLPTLKQCLIDTDVTHLRVIERLWGLEIKAKRPLEIATELAVALSDPDNAMDVWSALTEREQVALQVLIDAGGQLPAPAFARRFGAIRPMGPGRLEREAPWRDPETTTEALWLWGLIYEGFAADAKEMHPIFFVPAELRAALPVQAHGEGPRLRLASVDPPDRVQGGGDLLLHDVTTVLSFVLNQGVRLRAGLSRSWPDQTLEAVQGWLRDANPERLVFIIHLIEHLDWVQQTEDGHVRLVPEPVMQWLQADIGNAQRHLIDGWRRLTDWNELWRLTDLQPDDAGTWRNDPTLAREALLRFLCDLEPGAWVSVDDFVNAVKTVDPDFQRPGGDYEAWYVRDPASGQYLKGFDSWDRVEGELLRALLTGPAHWLGLVNLGLPKNATTPDRFCVATSPLEPRESPPPVIQSDSTIIMPAALRYERFQLARIATLDRVGDPYTYRITPASMERARSQRIDLERMLHFLSELSAAPLPETVRSGLSRWHQEGTEVWLEEVVLLRVTSEELLQQIVNQPKTGRYIKRVLGPTAAVVSQKDWSRLRTALAESGLLAEVVQRP